MLRFATVTLDPAHEPPRPDVTPRQRVTVLRRGTAGESDYVEDWGLQSAFPARFVSSERQGFVTSAQAATLLALYETGAGFQLETDLLKPLGGLPDTYAAIFDPDTRPAFTPATPGGTLYRFDILVLLTGGTS